jgi:hypothetical protein
MKYKNITQYDRRKAYFRKLENKTDIYYKIALWSVGLVMIGQFIRAMIIYYG